jgi:hypothetical protein
MSRIVPAWVGRCRKQANTLDGAPRSRNALRRRHSGAKPGRQTPPNRCRQRTSAYLTISNLEQHFRQARPTSVIGSLLCIFGFEFGCRVRTGTAMAK